MTEDEAEGLMDLIAKAAELKGHPQEFTISDFAQAKQYQMDDDYIFRVTIKHQVTHMETLFDYNKDGQLTRDELQRAKIDYPYIKNLDTIFQGAFNADGSILDR